MDGSSASSIMANPRRMSLEAKMAGFLQVERNCQDKSLIRTRHCEPLQVVEIVDGMRSPTRQYPIRVSRYNCDEPPTGDDAVCVVCMVAQLAQEHHMVRRWLLCGGGTNWYAAVWRSGLPAPHLLYLTTRYGPLLGAAQAYLSANLRRLVTAISACIPGKGARRCQPGRARTGAMAILSEPG